MGKAGEICFATDDTDGHGEKLGLQLKQYSPGHPLTSVLSLCGERKERGAREDWGAGKSRH